VCLLPSPLLLVFLVLVLVLLVLLRLLLRLLLLLLLLLRGCCGGCGCCWGCLLAVRDGGRCAWGRARAADNKTPAAEAAGGVWAQSISRVLSSPRTEVARAPW